MAAAQPSVVSVFDFDGTLFRSPAPSEALLQQFPNLTQPVFAKGLGWFQSWRTLAPPYVPPTVHASDANWFIQPTLEAYKAARRDGHITALLTGREESYRERITQILRDAEIPLDFVYLKTAERGGTVVFKVRIFMGLLDAHAPKRIVYYEDRPDQGRKILAAFREAYNTRPDAASAAPFDERFQMIMVDPSLSDTTLPPALEGTLIEQLLADAAEYKAASKASRANHNHRGRGGNRGGGHRGGGGDSNGCVNDVKQSQN